MMNLNKVALVTGAAKGIGKAITIELLSKNYQVVMVDNNKQNLGSTQKELLNSYKNGNLHSYYCDVGNTMEVNELLSQLDKLNILPCVLINNAGYGGPFQILSDVSDEEWEKVIDTNLRSIFNFSRKLLPKMRENGWGRIINIASIQGLIGACLSSSYVASKHGVVGYTKAIAAEWGKYSITCNAICPGYVDTDMGVQNGKFSDHYKRIISRTPIGKIAAPQDIAYLVEFIASEKASFINGSIINIDGGIMADVGIS
ncbi:MAG TPA: SDR family NAD(P)-dependent oxidoreductase [Aquella sp.]|nr:SDR family NAD(P)-dependent oxidoreductase [Aquella sp.]